jgi:hypothetical protein
MKTLLNHLREKWSYFQRPGVSRNKHHIDLLTDSEGAGPRSELDRLSLNLFLDPPVRPLQQTDTGSIFPEASTTLIRYLEPKDLRAQWQKIDQPEDAWQLTVVLMLDQKFNSSLPGLIRRAHHGLRLLISSSTGRLPGTTSAGDLALHSMALGWDLISFHRTLAEALAAASQPLTWNERRVLFFPHSLTNG